MEERQQTQMRAYRELLRRARRFARTGEEAEDLAQEVLLVALESALDDWSSPRHQAWLFGVARNRAAFGARSSARRRNRERVISEAVPERKLWPFAWEPWFVRSLPRSLQAVAKLASADLTSGEIRWLLRLSPTALRTRLKTLRRAVRAQEELPIVAAPSSGPHFGEKRSLLLSSVKRAVSRTLGTLDPDGHVLFFRDAAHKTSALGNSQGNEFIHVET